VRAFEEEQARVQQMIEEAGIEVGKDEPGYRIRMKVFQNNTTKFLEFRWIAFYGKLEIIGRLDDEHDYRRFRFPSVRKIMKVEEKEKQESAASKEIAAFVEEMNRKSIELGRVYEDKRIEATIDSGETFFFSMIDIVGKSQRLLCYVNIGTGEVKRLGIKRFDDIRLIDA
jgi:hypothetical protein